MRERPKMSDHDQRVGGGNLPRGRGKADDVEPISTYVPGGSNISSRSFVSKTK